MVIEDDAVPQEESDGLVIADSKLLLKVYYAVRALKEEFQDYKSRQDRHEEDIEIRMRKIESWKNYIAGAIAILGGVPFVLEIIDRFRKLSH